MTTLHRIVPAAFAVLLLTAAACRRSDSPAYVQFAGPEQTDDWDPFEELAYNVRLPEGTPSDAAFDLRLTVRHSDAYRSDRVRLIITQADENRAYRPDTITVMLSDKEGNWKGERNFSVYTCSILLREDFRPGPGTTFGIRPDSPEPLAGISKIGLSLTSPSR
ncbi:MAG: hypothetical protein U0L83_05680 [Muribaculaceae bacterium]|nr:hypothetical protein [Muribaculaceae bacterium]